MRILPVPEAPKHIPVLAEESIQAMQIISSGCYVDATFGRGGHSTLILEQLGNDGQLVVFDQDEEAITYGKRYFKNEDRIAFVHDNFAHMQKHLEAMALKGSVDSVLMDIGVSSPQLDQADRGFSFMRDGPLDMRMNQSVGMSAYDYLYTD